MGTRKKPSPDHSESPVIYLIYCGEDKAQKDTIVEHLKHNWKQWGLPAALEFIDYERDGSGHGLLNKYKGWLDSAWYVLLLISNHWRSLTPSMQSELATLDKRVEAIRDKYGWDNPFVSAICLEDPLDEAVETYWAGRYDITWETYTYRAIDHLIKRFQVMPPWKQSDTPDGGTVIGPSVTVKNFLSKKVNEIEHVQPRFVSDKATISDALTVLNFAPLINQLFLAKDPKHPEGNIRAFLTRGRIIDFLPPMVDFTDEIAASLEMSAEDVTKLANEMADSCYEAKALGVAFRQGEFPVLGPDDSLDYALNGFLAKQGLNHRRVRALAIMRGTTAYGVLGYWNLIGALYEANLIPDAPISHHLTPNDEIYIASQDDTIATLRKQMQMKDAAQFPIVKDKTSNIYVGTIRREMVRNLTHDSFSGLSYLPVRLFLENFQPRLDSSNTLRDAAEFFLADTGFPMLAVLKKGTRELMGAITYVDILRAVIARAS